MNNTMKLVVFLCVLSIVGILILGGNMYKDVPVIKVNMSLVEMSDGVVDTQNHTLIQDSVNYINRPKKTKADSFPAVIGRTTLLKGKNSSIGPWESVSYNGPGSYIFNIGFREDRPPKPGDMVHITVMIVDKDGTKIGYLMENIEWK